MLIIEATFTDGTTQRFGNPQDLHRYMCEEGYTEAVVDTRYVFDRIIKSRMSMKEIAQWAAA